MCFKRPILCDFDAILGQILNQPCGRAVFSWPVVTITTISTTRVAVSLETQIVPAQYAVHYTVNKATVRYACQHSVLNRTY